MGLTVLIKYKKILDKLSKDRIFLITYSEDTFSIVENCDQYFCHKLTKQECEELSNLFREMAEMIM